MASNITLSPAGREEFANAAVAVTSGTLTEIFRIVNVNGRRIGMTLTIGSGGALGELTISRAMKSEGTHKNMFVENDSTHDLDEANSRLPSIEPAGGAGSTILNADETVQIELDGAASEYGVWAKKASASTTLAIEGNAG